MNQPPGYRPPGAGRPAWPQANDAPASPFPSPGVPPGEPFRPASPFVTPPAGAAPPAYGGAPGGWGGPVGYVLAAHPRAQTVLILGIVSWVLPCAGLVCGIIAWVMGAQVIRETRENPSLYSQTDSNAKIGMWLGIAHVVLIVAVVVLYVGIFGIGLLAAFAGAAGR